MTPIIPYIENNVPVSENQKEQIRSLLRATKNFNEEEISIAEELLEAGSEEGYECWLCTQDDYKTIIGFIIFGKTPMTQGVWDMYYLSVHPNHYGKGVAQELE